MLGPVGVGFFFVLSGFVLAWAWQPKTTRRQFYQRRFARIYPMHLLTTMVATIVSVGAGDPHWASVWVTVLLIQCWFTDTFRAGGNGPSWSLSCEMFFYVCFPFLVFKISRATRRGLLR